MKNKREIEKKKGERKVTVCFAVALLVTLTGCGNAAKNTEYGSGQEPVSVSQAEETKGDDTLRDESENSGVYDGGTDNAEAQISGSLDVKAQERQSQGGSGQDESRQSSAEAAESSNSQKPEPTDSNAQESEKLIGTVKSIGENSIVISRAFEVASDILVEPGEGSPDEALVTIACSINTKYEVWSVKNGGVNGDSDVDKKAGSFSDITESANVNIIGKFEGDSFYAEHIIIYYFI